MRDSYIRIGRPIDHNARWWATALAERVGPTEAARRIGISRATLAAVIAGLPVAATTELRVCRAQQRQERKAA
jgi:hypothetical protein